MYLYANSGGAWVLTTILSGPQDLVQPDFGVSVALDGNTVAVGAPGLGAYTGAVVMYSFANGVWSELGELTMPGLDPQAGMGTAVALSGNYLTATSGLPVSVSSLTPGVCDLFIDGVTLFNVGVCSVQAAQAGTYAFMPAASVIRSFNVTPRLQTISLTLAPVNAISQPGNAEYQPAPVTNVSFQVVP